MDSFAITCNEIGGKSLEINYFNHPLELFIKKQSKYGNSNLLNMSSQLILLKKITRGCQITKSKVLWIIFILCQKGV